jgi:hypothetical protein
VPAALADPEDREVPRPTGSIVAIGMPSATAQMEGRTAGAPLETIGKPAVLAVQMGRRFRDSRPPTVAR